MQPTAPGLISLTVNGARVQCVPNLTIAAVFLADQLGPIRRSSRLEQPRSLWCGMGICHECSVRVDGRDNQRACMVTARDGMVIETQDNDARLEAS